MLRKKVACLLAAAICIGCLQGCGNNETGSLNENTEVESGEEEQAVQPDSIPTVKVCLPNYDSPADTDAVEAAINEIAGEKYGINMDIEFISTGNWVQQTNLMLTSDEVDVLALYGTPFSSFINNGQLVDLTEYWANASDEFRALWTDEEMRPFISGGKLYAIPNFRDYGGYLGGFIDEDIAAEFGIEHDQTLTWEELDDFLQRAHEKYPERYGLVPTGGTALISKWTWDGMGDDKYLGVLSKAGWESMEVVKLFEAEDFLNFTSWARKWYEDGITMPDILSNTESWKSLFAADKAIAAINSVGANKETGLINFRLEDNFLGTDVYQSVSYGINANSSNPDASWTALEALYTDREIGVLLVNGIEGKNYVLNEDGSASYPDGLDASTAGYNLVEAYWFVPYCPHSYPKAENGGEFFNNMVKQKEEAKASAAFGFAFDSSPVIDEYTACTNVMDKYYKALMSGAVDPVNIMEQAGQELDAAGLDKVIEEKKNQLDAWIAQNK
ncbi:MAG: ABC transporter substrate-binding protein [Lachnospiraceae bacterium]|jgi:putative aldouronate transport system substrate-binding protein|nr:ABC transporter substrate-binding protein [Lachnospiraceae bacterium]